MPVFNEEQSLSEVLDEALAVAAAAPLLLGNRAGGRRQHRPQHRDSPRLRAPTRRRRASPPSPDQSRNHGRSVETLYNSARGRYVFFNASDGQWKTAECLRFLESRDRYDIVVGRRRVKNYTLWRRIVSDSFNLLPRILFGVRTYDAGSIKLFRADVLRIPLLSQSPFREAERIIRANRRGLSRRRG